MTKSNYQPLLVIGRVKQLKTLEAYIEEIGIL
ncbi:hypothetical protein BH10BAC1_BH10BAC1_09070 [soil metagenome]